MKEIVIEDGETNLSILGGFKGCPLENLYLGRNLDDDNDHNSNIVNTLKKLTIGNNVTSIRSYTVNNCSDLNEVYCLCATPPSVGDNNFTNVNYMNTKVYVPTGSLAAYQAADVWENFWYMQEFDPAGVKTITVGDSKPKEIYNINGIKLNTPQRGLNIINGKKVFVE